MKKILSVLLCTILCLSFVACGSVSDNSTNNVGDNSCSHVYITATCTEPQKCSQCGVTSGPVLGHEYSDATCTEPQKCSRCGITKGAALGHTTSTGTCTRCSVSFSKWEKRYYTDEFNNPTTNAFIAPVDMLSGTFSNSATTNSKLSAYVRVDDEDCQIMLWEYGSNLVKAYSSTDYNITILLPDGTKKYFTGTMYKNGQVINFDDYNGILTLLKSTNGSLKIYIKEDSDYGVNSTYLFEVNTSGFKNLYNQTFN